MENQTNRRIEIRYIEEKQFANEKEMKQTIKTSLMLDAKNFKELVYEIIKLVSDKEYKRDHEIKKLKEMYDGR